jgi:5'-nucleotidase
MTKPFILLANDDGIHATGLRMLAQVLSEFANIWIVAPDRERSATSHSISLHKPLRIRQLAVQEYCVDGTPADCVYLAIHHLLPQKPDVIVSGINHGSNIGSDVLYSGTISAAMEGALLGCAALAISMSVPKEGGPQESEYFVRAAQAASVLVRSVVRKPMPRGVLLNVNVPYVEKPLGFKLCRLGFTDWSHNVVERHDPRGRPYYWIGGARTDTLNMPDSDSLALEQGYISVTPVHYDLTDFRSFGFVRDLKIGEDAWVNDDLGTGPLPYLLKQG